MVQPSESRTHAFPSALRVLPPSPAWRRVVRHMGAASSVPAKLDKAEAQRAAGDLFDEMAFNQAATNGSISRDEFLRVAAERGGPLLPDEAATVARHEELMHLPAWELCPPREAMGALPAETSYGSRIVSMMRDLIKGNERLASFGEALAGPAKITVTQEAFDRRVLLECESDFMKHQVPVLFYDTIRRGGCDCPWQEIYTPEEREALRAEVQYWALEEAENYYESAGRSLEHLVRRFPDVPRDHVAFCPEPPPNAEPPPAAEPPPIAEPPPPTPTLSPTVLAVLLDRYHRLHEPSSLRSARAVCRAWRDAALARAVRARAVARRPNWKHQLDAVSLMRAAALPSEHRDHLPPHLWEELKKRHGGVSVEPTRADDTTVGGYVARVSGTLDAQRRRDGVNVHVQNVMERARDEWHAVEEVRGVLGCLTEAHWSELCKALGSEAYRPAPSATAAEYAPTFRALKASSPAAEAALSRILDRASKEKAVTTHLQMIEAAWELKIAFAPPRGLPPGSAPACCLPEVETLYQMRDDHAAQVLALSWVRAWGGGDHLVQRCEEWVRRLEAISELLDQWTRALSRWTQYGKVFAEGSGQGGGGGGGGGGGDGGNDDGGGEEYRRATAVLARAAQRIISRGGTLSLAAFPTAELLANGALRSDLQAAAAALDATEGRIEALYERHPFLCLYSVSEALDDFVGRSEDAAAVCRLVKRRLMLEARTDAVGDEAAAITSVGLLLGTEDEEELPLVSAEFPLGVPTRGVSAAAWCDALLGRMPTALRGCLTRLLDDDGTIVSYDTTSSNAAAGASSADGGGGDDGSSPSSRRIGLPQLAAARWSDAARANAAPSRAPLVPLPAVSLLAELQFTQAVESALERSGDAAAPLEALARVLDADLATLERLAASTASGHGRENARIARLAHLGQRQRGDVSRLLAPRGGDHDDGCLWAMLTLGLGQPAGERPGLPSDLTKRLADAALLHRRRRRQLRLERGADVTVLARCGGGTLPVGFEYRYIKPFPPCFPLAAFRFPNVPGVLAAAAAHGRPVVALRAPPADDGDAASSLVASLQGLAVHLGWRSVTIQVPSLSFWLPRSDSSEPPAVAIRFLRWGRRTRERAAEPPQLAIWNVRDADAGNVHRLLAQILKEAPPAAEGAPPTFHAVAVSCADDVNLDDEAGVGSGLAVVHAAG